MNGPFNLLMFIWWIEKKIETPIPMSHRLMEHFARDFIFHVKRSWVEIVWHVLSSLWFKHHARGFVLRVEKMMWKKNSQLIRTVHGQKKSRIWRLWWWRSLLWSSNRENAGQAPCDQPAVKVFVALKLHWFNLTTSKKINKFTDQLVDNSLNWRHEENFLT